VVLRKNRRGPTYGDALLQPQFELQRPEYGLVVARVGVAPISGRRAAWAARNLHIAVHNHVFTPQRHLGCPGGEQGHSLPCGSEFLSANILGIPACS